MRDDKGSQDRDTQSPEVFGGDGVDRRGFLQCMAWAGTGLVWAATGGVFSSRILNQASAAERTGSDFSFVQVSDKKLWPTQDPGGSGAGPQGGGPSGGSQPAT